MTAAARRPAPALLLPLVLSVLGVSGCSFQGGVTQDRSTAPATVASTPTTPPSTAQPSTPQPSAPEPAPHASTAPRASSPSPRATTTPSTGTSGAATRSATAPAAQTCRTADLQVAVAPDGQGAAGSLHTDVTFVNAGTATCVLSGHPGVSYVAGDDGHQVGAAAARQGTVLTPVSLAPGASAHAPLRIVGLQGFDAATCRPTPVMGYRVYPPDQTASAFIAQPGTACADPSTPQLTVGAVEPGTPSP